MVLSILIIPILPSSLTFHKKFGSYFFKILSIDIEYSDIFYPNSFSYNIFLVTILHFFVKLNPVLNLLILIWRLLSIFYFKKGNKFIFL